VATPLNDHVVPRRSRVSAENVKGGSSKVKEYHDGPRKSRPGEAEATVERQHRRNNNPRHIVRSAHEKAVLRRTLCLGRNKQLVGRIPWPARKEANGRGEKLKEHPAVSPVTSRARTVSVRKVREKGMPRGRRCQKMQYGVLVSATASTVAQMSLMGRTSHGRLILRHRGRGTSAGRKKHPGLT